MSAELQPDLYKAITDAGKIIDEADCDLLLLYGTYAPDAQIAESCTNAEPPRPVPIDVAVKLENYRLKREKIMNLKSGILESVVEIVRLYPDADTRAQQVFGRSFVVDPVKLPDYVKI